MTQTLTTEQLRARAKFWLEKAVEAKWESVSIAQDMLLNAEAFEELAANREAQPEGFYTTVSGVKGVVWHNGTPEDDTAIYTAPPAPVVNQTFTGNWIACNERLPDTDGNYWGWWSDSKRQGLCGLSKATFKRSSKAER